MRDVRQCCSCGDYHPVQQMAGKPSRDGMHTLYVCNGCHAATEKREAAVRELVEAATEALGYEGVPVDERLEAAIAAVRREFGL